MRVSVEKAVVDASRLPIARGLTQRGLRHSPGWRHKRLVAPQTTQGHLLAPVGDPESFAAPRVVCGATRGSA
jgi:hypothetical protein